MPRDYVPGDLIDAACTAMEQEQECRVGLVPIVERELYSDRHIAAWARGSVGTLLPKGHANVRLRRLLGNV